MQVYQETCEGLPRWGMERQMEHKGVKCPGGQWHMVRWQLNEGSCSYGSACKFPHTCDCCQGPHPAKCHCQRDGKAAENELTPTQEV